MTEDDGLGAGLLSVLAVLQIVPYYLMGFETIPKCSEEAAGDFEARRFVRVMLWALGAATLFYVMVIAVVALLVFAGLRLAGPACRAKWPLVF